MSTDDRDPAGQPLPVTAEVGDEGGSQADGAQQAATFSDVFGHPRVDSVTAVSAGAAGPDSDDPPGDRVTHATDWPPDDGRPPR
jgi:hypothetical protein